MKEGGLGIDLAQQAERAIDQPVIEPSRCYQRRNGHGRRPKPPLVLIAGPTASGKSALALALAQQIGGVIVNADSAQVYRDLPILSAAPTHEELKRAEHRLYGVQDGALPCSAADWARDGAARDRGHPFERAARRSWSAEPAFICARCSTGSRRSRRSTPEVRARVRRAPVEENRAKLQALDPGRGRAAPRRRHDPDQPRARGHPVDRAHARRMAEAARAAASASRSSLRPLILLPPRKWLYARCDERFAHMIDARRGRARSKRCWRASSIPNLPVMRAIGVRELSRYLLGESSLDEAVAAGQQATRRYAKRQYTWFAHQPPADWPRFREALDVDRLGRCAGPARAEGLGGRQWTCCATPTSIPLRSPASASRSLGYGNQGRAQALNLQDSGDRRGRRPARGIGKHDRG